jgi:hypothetical protein
MTGLFGGVTFRPDLPDGGDLADRIEVSAGTVSAASLVPEVGRYTDWAMVPRGPWRALRADERTQLMPTPS